MDDKLFSIDDLVKAPELQGRIGKSTIYRIISNMVDKGWVKKYHKKGLEFPLYLYTGPSEDHQHLHLRCTKCGDLIHVDDDKSKALVSSIKDQINFQIQSEETVLFGTCKNCLRDSDKKRKKDNHKED